jgi:hypothetical protein
MPADTLMVLQAAVTKTSTFQGAGLNIISGVFPGEVLVARVIYSAATNATGANSFNFTVEQSIDNATWYTVGGAGGAYTLNLTTTAQAGEIFIPFEVRVSPSTVGATGCWIRLVATLGGAGTVPTVTYQGDIVPAYP